VQHVVLPEAVLVKGKVGNTGGVKSVIEGRKVVRPDMPERAPFMQIDVVGGYSAACASTVQEGGAWPKEWAGSVFCTEPILDIIHHEKLVATGPTFTGDMVPPDREWLRAQDFWFFPIDVQFGPDGAMYVLDFYNPIVAHSDSRGPQHSRSGATTRPDRDHYFGRIYRIQHEQAQKLDVPDLSKADAPALVRAFTHPNKSVRSTAHRLLMDRADAASATTALVAMAEGEKFAPARILALWSLQRLGKLSPQIRQAALKSGDAGVRKCALLIAEDTASDPAATAALLGDPDPRVRLTALRVLASSKLTPETAAALLAVLPKLEDDWSKSAAVAAASSSPGPVLEAALVAKGVPGEALLELGSSLAAALAEKQDSAALAKVIAAAAKATPESAPLVEAVLEASSRHLPPAPAEALPGLQSLLASTNITLTANALPFAVAWDKDGALKSLAAERINTFLALAADASQSDATRAVAARSLVRARAADARILPATLELLKTKLSDPLRADIVSALAATNDASLGKPLTGILSNLPPAGQTTLFDALTSRADWANAVLDALEAKQFAASLLGPARLSRLRLHPDAATAKRAVKLIADLGGGTNPAKDEVIAKLRTEIEGKPGDSAKGHATFTAACATCHKFNGEGKEVGPLLDGIGVHGTAELLTHILDPSRVVDNEHRTWALSLKNGSFATGIIARENERSLTVRLPGGIEQEIKIADLKSRQDTGLSLMPEGFEALGAETLRDLLAFLAGGSGKYRAINLGNSFTTDTGAGLYNSREAKNDTVQPVKYGVVTVSGVPFSLPDPTTTPTGGNVIVLKNSDGETYASTMPQRVEIPVGFPAGNLHFLGGVAGWGGKADSHRPAMKVTIEHADGAKQVVELFTGDVFIDYPSGDDVPGSKRAEGVVKKHHVRFFSLPVESRGPIAKLILESYKNGISPTTLAITADNDAPVPRKIFSAGADDPADFKPQFDDAVPQPPAQRPTKGPRVLLVGGGSSHDFLKFFGATDKATLAPGVGWVEFTQNLNGIAPILKDIDVLVLSANQPISAETRQALLDFADAGKGIIALHPGTWYAWKNFPDWNTQIVGGGTRGHDKLGPYTVTLTNPAHPITKGVAASFEITDELYNYTIDPAGESDRSPRRSDQPNQRQDLPAGFRREASESAHRRHHPRPRRPRA
jgi:putative heme-binding domain-containing protein